MPTGTGTVKKSMDKGYGAFYFVSDPNNEHSEDGKDWCVFPSKECQGLPATGAIPNGTSITFEYTDSTKNGRVSTYMNKVDVVGGQQTAQQTQQRVSTPPSSKDRQIFIQGVFQQMCMGAASGQVSESTLDGYFKAAEKYWLWFNNPSPMKPGDAPQNSDSNGYDSGRY
jgi:hypothetical protein